MEMCIRDRDMRDEPIPEDMMELAQKYHDELIEKVAEQDEALMEKYFSGEELTIDCLLYTSCFPG